VCTVKCFILRREFICMTGVKRIMRKEDEWGESNRRDQIDMGVETHVEARPHVHPVTLSLSPIYRV